MSTTATVQVPTIAGHGVREFNGYRLKEHLTNREIVWTPTKVQLYQPGSLSSLFAPPMTGRDLLGYARRGDHLVNAHVCDHVEDRAELYFEEWRQRVGGNGRMMSGVFRKIHFFGSIFVGENGDEAVKTLFYDDEMGRLSAIFSSLNGIFFYNDFVITPHYQG